MDNINQCCRECGDIYQFDELDRETGLCKECYKDDNNGSLEGFTPGEEPI